MKTKTKHIIGLAALLLVLFIPQMLMAADGSQAADDAIRGWFAKFSAWQFLLVPVVTAFIMLFRKYVMLIPDQLWPYLAPFIGVGLNFLAIKVGLWTGNAEVGLLMGGLAVWFSQVGKQTKELIQEGASRTASGVSNEKK